MTHVSPSLLDSNSKGFETKQGPSCHLCDSKILSPTRPHLQLDPCTCMVYIRTFSQKTFFKPFSMKAPPQQACHNVTIPHHVRNKNRIIRQHPPLENTKARGQKPGIVGFPASVATSSSPSLLALRCPPSVGLGHKSTHQGLYPAEIFRWNCSNQQVTFQK